MMEFAALMLCLKITDLFTKPPVRLVIPVYAAFLLVIHFFPFNTFNVPTATLSGVSWSLIVRTNSCG